MFCTYLVYCGSNIYVGSGRYPERLRESLRERNGERCREVLITDSREEAQRLEDYLYINLSKRGYTLLNRVRPGRNGISIWPEDCLGRKLVSIYSKGNTYGLGHKHSQETVEIIRQRALGRSPSLEIRQKISTTLQGRLHTQEHNKKISSWWILLTPEEQDQHRRRCVTNKNKGLVA